VQTSWANLWPKFQILTVLGVVFDKCDNTVFSHLSSYCQLPNAKFHIYRGNVSPLRGKKPILRSLSKRNTGMAALRLRQTCQ